MFAVSFADPAGNCYDWYEIDRHYRTIDKPSPAADTACPAGAIRRSGDALYRCIQAHTSQAGWEPENVPALWGKIKQK